MVTKTNIKTLVSILRESALYPMLDHEERIALLIRLLRDYPGLADSHT